MKYQIYFMAADKPDLDRFNNLNKFKNGRVLNFYTSNLEELSIIARHRMLSTPTVIVLSGNKVVLRVVRPPNDAKLLDVLSSFVDV